MGSIGEALSHDDRDETATEARVLVRLISLESCPPEFASLVTRATNTQNRIVSRDFVALDSEQERLRVEMRIEGRSYALKTGEPDPPDDEGCSVVDATVALSCADPHVQLAVQAKREIGKIWEDTSAGLYRRIFNSSTSSTRVWRAVQIMRAVDGFLHETQLRAGGRRRQTAIHGNRLLLHLVFRQLPNDVLNGDSAFPSEDTLAHVASTLFDAMATKVERDYEGNYLASLFKNLTKSRDVADAVSADRQI